MTKLTSPLFGLRASGTVGKHITYQHSKDLDRAISLPTHPDAGTIDQLLQRQLYLHAIQEWHWLSPAQKLSYSTLAAGRPYTGYNLFLRQYLALEEERATISYLPLSERTGAVASDKSGYGTNAAIVGATWRTLSTQRPYLSFDGTDDYLQIPDSPDMKVQEFSIEVWLAITALGWMAIYCDGSPESSNYGATLRFRNSAANPVGLTIGDSTIFEEIAPAQTYPLGQWNYLCLTYNNRAATMVVNDGSELALAFGRDISYDNAVQRIASRTDGTNDLLGDIAQVKYFSRQLTLVEQHRHYDQQRHLFP